MALSACPTPKELQDAYDNGLEGWIWTPKAQGDWDNFCGSLPAADDKLAAIKDLHKSRPRSLLYKAMEACDPGCSGQEAQTGPDCTSHGSRRGRDNTRAAEIVIKGEAEEFYKRGATEPTYGARGFAGDGMAPSDAAEFERDYGFLVRENYPDLNLDLTTYKFGIGDAWGRRGVPDAVKKECQKHNLDYVVPRTTEQALDCMANAYSGHSGQQWACSSNQPADGINSKSGTWNHDMAHGGYDLTQEIWKEPVVFIYQSWGKWIAPNKVWVKNQDILGPYMEGMMAVPLDDFDRYFVRSGSIFYYADVKGFPARMLPPMFSGVL